MTGATIFLKIEPIKGQSTVEGFKEEIELLSFSHGVTMPMTYGPSNQARTSGRPVHQDFTVTKYLDESSPEILDYLNKGEDIKKAIFTVTHADGTSGKLMPIWTVVLENAIFTSVSIGGSGHGELPTETVTMNYATITWEFKPQAVAADKKGQKAAGWDLTKNMQHGGKK